MARLGGAPHHLVGSGNLRQTLLALRMLGEPLLQHQTVHLATARGDELLRLGVGGTLLVEQIGEQLLEGGAGGGKRPAGPGGP